MVRLRSTLQLQQDVPWRHMPSQRPVQISAWHSTKLAKSPQTLRKRRITLRSVLLHNCQAFSSPTQMLEELRSLLVSVLELQISSAVANNSNAWKVFYTIAYEPDWQILHVPGRLCVTKEVVICRSWMQCCWLAAQRMPTPRMNLQGHWKLFRGCLMLGLCRTPGHQMATQ